MRAAGYAMAILIIAVVIHACFEGAAGTVIVVPTVLVVVGGADPAVMTRMRIVPFVAAVVAILESVGVGVVIVIGVVAIVAARVLGDLVSDKAADDDAADRRGCATA